MSETPAATDNHGGQHRQGSAVTDDAVSEWFLREIMPLEAILMHYLRHNWQNASDIADLRQEVYARVFESARERIPDNAKRFLLTSARNLLIDLVRRSQVVPIEAVADIEQLEIAIDTAGPERAMMAREHLRRIEGALGELPPRAREAVTLAYAEGLSGKEIAERMGVSKSTASEHLSNGIRILTDLFYGAAADRSGKS